VTAVSQTSDVLLEERGRAGIISLNRPQALNALTLGMIDAIAAALNRWEHDPRIAHVIVRQGASRAFCAGGDIRTLAAQITAQKWQEVDAFYRREYHLNRRIKRYPKPYIALIDGIVRGGGVGISIHGRYRVGSEKLAFAMPEVGIGLFPDVGGTYFLPRMPGRLGLYLALTGERIALADALYAGVLTHHVPGTEFPALIDALAAGDDSGAILDAFCQKAGTAPLEDRMAELSRLLSGNSLPELMAHLRALAAAGEADAQKLADLLSVRSPTSLALAFRQVKEGAHLDFEACMQIEYRIVNRIVRGHDFTEGVRAVIIDKDNAPRWEPSTIAAIDWQRIEEHFAPLLRRELDFA